MAIAPLQLPSSQPFTPQIDFQTPLARIGDSIDEAQRQKALKQIGQGLADGTMDYRQAAGLAAEAGRTDLSLNLLRSAEERDASNRFTSALSGGQGQPPAPQGAAPTVSSLAVSTPTINQPPPNAQPRSPVMPTNRVWGDNEAVNAGIYDPPPPQGGKVRALSGRQHRSRSLSLECRRQPPRNSLRTLGLPAGSLQVRAIRLPLQCSAACWCGGRSSIAAPAA